MEIYRDKIPTPSKSSASSRPSIPKAFIAKTSPIRELALQASRTLYQLSKYHDGVPRSVHQRILQSLHGNQPAALAASTSNRWSDGSIWIQVLEMGASQQSQVTILNMLEYMGAWEWYNGQVQLAQTMISTRKGRPVDRRSAAIYVLDGIQDRRIIPEGQGKWISGAGMIKLGSGEPNQEPISSSGSMTEKAKHEAGKRAGFGILFSKKIWEYTKRSNTHLNDLVQHIQADPQHMKLLQILGPQLERLVNHGSPDFRKFLVDVQQEGLISKDETQELQVAFALGDEALPDGRLNTAIDCLVEGVKEKVLNQATLDPNDILAVNGSMELECKILQHLRPGQQLDAWTILAAMQISDRPAFVRHEKSIPLDEIIKLELVKRTRPFRRPLAAWAKKISSYRRKAKEIFGDVVPLVYFCPINHMDSHYTLLEINKRERVIRHYNSLADRDGVNKTWMSRLVKDKFGALKFSYQEAPTPQQNNAWSCGIRVIWNFQQLSNNLPIGGWDRVLNPEPMTLEIVQGLVACVEDNAMERYQR
ncbi:hypothetical protein BDV12DRAFT_200881 [Aspergillus spectabilis]